MSASPYIVSPGFDGLFIIGSPLLAIGVVLGGGLLVDPHLVAIAVAFVALGHHVPTLLRACGDYGENRANRLRLIGVPLLVGPIIFLSYAIDARLVAFIFIWDQFHFVRQHYGFMRIYDAKVGVISQDVARLDQWLCFSWFAAIIVHSGYYKYLFSGSFYELTVTPPIGISVLFETGTVLIAGGVTLAYLRMLFTRMRRGERVAPLKLILFATTYATWWFAYAAFSDLLLTYAISSFFHCLQYDAFAWHYNRKQSENAAFGGGSRLLRFIHQPRNLWVYAGLLCAYGGVSSLMLGYSPYFVVSLNMTTAVLHYYFDSFIWKVRRPEFRRYL